MVNLFSVGALFIMYREALEAAVVISVMISIMERLGFKKLKKQVWLGAISGIVIAVILGVAFCIAYYVGGNKIWGSTGEYIFKGFNCIIAAMLILWLSFAMLKFMGYEAEWEAKLGEATERATTETKQGYQVFILALTTTLREGIESVLFLTSVGSTTGAASIPIPGILGIVLGIITGMAVFWSGKLLKDIRYFFYFSTVFLLFVGAGLARTGIHYFQIAGWMGTWYPFWERPILNRPMFTMYSCCSNQGTGFWPLMSALFGYQDDPSPLEWMFYFGFWILAGVIFVVKLRRGTLTAAGKVKGGVSYCSTCKKDLEADIDSVSEETAEKGDLESGRLPKADKDDASVCDDPVSRSSHESGSSHEVSIEGDSRRSSTHN